MPCCLKPGGASQSPPRRCAGHQECGASSILLLDGIGRGNCAAGAPLLKRSLNDTAFFNRNPSGPRRWGGGGGANASIVDPNLLICLLAYFVGLPYGQPHYPGRFLEDFGGKIVLSIRLSAAPGNSEQQRRADRNVEKSFVFHSSSPCENGWIRYVVCRVGW
jgi:hypothetical protein